MSFLIPLVTISKDSILMPKKQKHLPSHSPPISPNQNSNQGQAEVAQPKWSSENLPRSINTHVRRAMKSLPEHRQIFMRVDRKILSVPRYRITEPLFILKLHSRLYPQHMQLYLQLTKQAMMFIDEKRQQNFGKINTYVRKLKAYQMLLVSLRQKKMPNKSQIVSFIRAGIYGYAKNKYSKEVASKVENIMRFYGKGLKAPQI